MENLYRDCCQQHNVLHAFMFERLRSIYMDLGPRQPSALVTTALAKVTFHLFLCKLKPTVYMMIGNPSRGDETTQVGKLVASPRQV